MFWQRLTGFSLALAGLGLGSGLACSSPTAESLGSASIAITQVPSDGSVGCIAITATGTFTVTRSFDVTPMESTAFEVTGLPTGTVSFVGDAYAGACSGVMATSAPTWVSVPVLASLQPGQVPLVVLEMHVAGDADVGVDFGGEPSCRSAGEPCLGAMECCSNSCVAGACQTGATCQPNGSACATAADCCGGICTGGVCGAGMCLPPFIQCGAACIDIQADPNNCGGCGKVCPPGELCAMGGCFPAGPCPPPLTQCGGACVYLEADQNNCGACGLVCPAGTQCEMGACFPTGPCPPPLTQCGATCIDTQKDPANCGFCGDVCPTGTTCEMGACIPAGPCPPPLALCGGACVDVTSDPGNCGFCGDVCPAGTACEMGSCLPAPCPPPLTLCGATCTDTQGDKTNCGACGNLCPFGDACSMGVCVGMGPVCTDGIQDGSETDVDCGGGACPACSIGKKCGVDTDCVSNACDGLALVCVTSQCADHQRDGNETDLDCGGGACPTCGSGRACAVNSDCSSGFCAAGVCK